MKRATTKKMSWECITGSCLHVQALAVLYSSVKCFKVFKLLALRTLHQSTIEYLRGET